MGEGVFGVCVCLCEAWSYSAHCRDLRRCAMCLLPLVIYGLTIDARCEFAAQAADRQRQSRLSHGQMRGAERQGCRFTEGKTSTLKTEDMLACVCSRLLLAAVHLWCVARTSRERCGERPAHRIGYVD